MFCSAPQLDLFIETSFTQHKKYVREIEAALLTVNPGLWETVGHDKA